MHCYGVAKLSVAVVAFDPAYLQQPPKIKLKIVVQSLINIQLKKAGIHERQEGWGVVEVRDLNLNCHGQRILLTRGYFGREPGKFLCILEPLVIPQIVVGRVEDSLHLQC